MENIYKAYTKEINGKTFYFIKRFSSFPEYPNFAPVLESMGMHTDFYKACNLAKVEDELAINNLRNELHIIPDSATVIHLHRVKAMTHSLIKSTHHAILKLRLASIS